MKKNTPPLKNSGLSEVKVLKKERTLGGVSKKRGKKRGGSPAGKNEGIPHKNSQNRKQKKLRRAGKKQMLLIKPERKGWSRKILTREEKQPSGGYV